MQNIVTFTLQCDQPSILYWAIGVDPSLLDVNFQAIQKNVQGKDGLKANYSDPTDIYWRVYGTEIFTVSQPLAKTFTGLKSSSNYQI